MLSCQKEKFSLEDTVTYINGAYMSPSLKTVEAAGHKAVTQKTRPYEIVSTDFFDKTEKLRQMYAQFIGASDHHNTAVIPSASYGLATVANNIRLTTGDEILMVEEQFPSNFYVWQKLAEAHNAVLKVVKAPKIDKNRAKIWNQNILDGISSRTAVVTMPPTHWADGTLFDLKAIREKTKQYNALLVLDGSQFIGAAPFSVEEIQPDALITVSYKWLLGPYSMGMGYYSDYFNDGSPIEENWINRYNSEEFSGLVNYEARYQPKAGRYNMGERSNFINTPMLIESLKQLGEWTPAAIQDFCHSISAKAIDQLRALGCFIEEDAYRSKHLFGVYLPEHIDLNRLKASFASNKVFVSFRGAAIRISPNVYNNEEDFERLLDCF